MMAEKILLYLVLGLALVTFVIPTLKEFLEKRKKNVSKSASVTAADAKEMTLPLQLQAYERLVVLLERISPENLIQRIHQPNLRVIDMQLLLVNQVRSEFDFNVAQQIYVSPISWEAVKTVKDQLITLINQIASRLPAEAPAIELNKKILEVFLQQENTPTAIALEILNTEAKKLL